MNYLIDTVVLIRYLSSSGKITEKVKNILDNQSGKNKFYISAISLMEILYLTEKNRINVSISEVIDIIKRSAFYSFVDLSPEIVLDAQNLIFMNCTTG